ncbi:MAG: C39 family peptidase [Clostridia bacterium]|nr:C39 family peptidase [Clostridia bacterium]
MKNMSIRFLSVLVAALMLVPLVVIQASAATTFERKLGVPVDYQYNYKTVRYTTSSGVGKTTSSSGCGAASASMVIEYFTGNTSQTPDTQFKWACDNGYYTGSGLSYSAVKKLCSNYGVTLTWVGTKDAIINGLKAGNPIIALMGPGTFTSGGHYIVLSGIKIEDGVTYVRVNDPNSSSRTNSYYKLDLVWSEKRTTSSTPFGLCTYSTAPKGAVSDYYVEVGKYSKVRSSDGFLNIRASASSSGTVKGTVNSGTFVKIESVTGNWAYITHNGISGYVYIPYLIDGGDATVAAPSLSAASTLAYGASMTVSWGAVANAKSYTYTAKLYNGEMSATSATTIASGTTGSTSFTIPAQSSGKYISISVTATDGNTSASSTATVMVGPWVGNPTGVEYVPVASINGSASESSSTVWTSANTSTFSGVYWRGFLCTPNADGSYTVSTVYEYGASKSVTVSGKNVLWIVHSSFENYKYCEKIVVGDKLTFCGVYFDSNTIRGAGHVLVNGGVPLYPTSLTLKDKDVSYDGDCFVGAGAGVTGTQILSKFNEDAEYVKVRDLSGKDVTGGVVGTGFTVNLVIEGSVAESYTIVIKGDVTCDGVISTADLMAVRASISGSNVFSGFYEKAGDFDGSGAVSTTDYAAVRKFLG